MDLALEFPAMECFNLRNCWMPEESIKMSSQWGRRSHSMFEACSRRVRAVFVNGFWQCCNFMVWGCCHWAEEDCAWDCVPFVARHCKFVVCVCVAWAGVEDVCVWMWQPRRSHDCLPESSGAHVQNVWFGMFENMCSSEHMFEVFETMFEVCSPCLSCSRATVSHFGMFVNICSRNVRWTYVRGAEPPHNVRRVSKDDWTFSFSNFVDFQDISVC